MHTWLLAAVLLPLLAALSGCEARTGFLTDIPVAGLSEGFGLAVADPPCFDPDLVRRALDLMPDLARAPGRIAFVCDGQIWTMRPDGSDHQPVTRPTPIDYSQVKSGRGPLGPLGQPPGPDEIAGYEQQMNTAPRWLGNDTIVFSSIRDTLTLRPNTPNGSEFFMSASEVYAARADGSGLERLTGYNLTTDGYPGACRPAWGCGRDGYFMGRIGIAPIATSPDGRQIAIGIAEIRQTDCCSDVAILDLRTNRFTRLEHSTGRRTYETLGTFVWSPEGRRAAVIRNLRDDFWEGPFLWELAVRDLATGRETAIYAAGTGTAFGWLAAPAWSPHGDKIAICGYMTPTREAAVPIVLVADLRHNTVATAGLPHDLNPTHGYQPCNATWSPDGRYLAVAYRSDGIHVFDYVSGHSATIARGRSPAWSGFGRPLGK